MDGGNYTKSISDDPIVEYFGSRQYHSSQESKMKRQEKYANQHFRMQERKMKVEKEKKIHKIITNIIHIAI